MQYDAYTNDAICTAMGLGPFEPAGERVIRLLLKPSFHPETCVTVEPTRLHAVALRSMLWHEPAPRRLPEYAESASLSVEQFDQIAGAFERAFDENAKSGKSVVLDGMSIAAIRIKNGHQAMFEEQPVGPHQQQFVSDVLRLAHRLVSSARLRNQIARCGRYVDRTFEIEPEPPAREVTRVMVLGTPGDRADYFDQLRKSPSGDLA